MAPEYQRALYDPLKAAGEEFGIGDFGTRALCRCGWRRASAPGRASSGRSTGPSKAGLDRFVDLDKNDFIGRKAAAREQRRGGKLRRARSSSSRGRRCHRRRADLGQGRTSISAASSLPHGYGAPRFDATGKARRSSSECCGTIHGIVDGPWRVVGWATSGGYAHYVRQSMAQGYVPAALAERRFAGLFEIEILGLRQPARIVKEPLFDPAGERMRG